ncbi:MAG: hypothetical protein HEP69_07890 [Aestuariivita sp.]|nr:hypothetical protein [Aestuariivita sp.]
MAGDVAHLTPPFAGQGMNAGLCDASNLAWNLTALLNGGASDDILDSYFDERRGPAWAMIQLAVVMGEITMPLASEQRAFRNHLMTSLVPFPGVQDYLLKTKFKPRPRCDKGLFADLHSQLFEGSLVGELIAQSDVKTGGIIDKLDTLLGKPLRTHRGQVLLVRPDRYCVAAFSSAALAERIQAFAAVLGVGQPRSSDVTVNSL